jgi:brefeldin A-inhibited guanine nucleotide-exchange protein
MFSSTWSAHLAVFSAVLADSEAEESIVADICLQGFVHAIRIAGFFAMADPRSAFVSSLAQFTAVAAGKEIKAKNVACIRELLNLALHTGDRLRDSWRPVLECISKIDHLRVLGLGDLTDSQYFQSQVDPTESPQSMSRQIMQRNASIVAD